MNAESVHFRDKLNKPFRLQLFLLKQLPLAFFSGVRIVELSEYQAVVSVRQKWFNKNPFHSIYFAVLSMAAEISTGLLCMESVYRHNPTVSMLVVKNQSLFHKKATGRISFTCADGDAIRKTIELAVSSRESQIVTCYSYARNEKDELVAEFYFTWSFKVKTNREVLIPPSLG